MVEVTDQSHDMLQGVHSQVQQGREITEGTTFQSGDEVEPQRPA